MEDKGKGKVIGDEENLISKLEEGPSYMEIDKEEHGGNDSDDNYDDEDVNSDEEGQVDDDDDDDEGDESEDGGEFEAGSEIPSTLERPEYDAQAEKKRKALADSQRLVFPYSFCFLLGYAMF